MSEGQPALVPDATALRHDPALDGLRAIAASLVVFFHIAVEMPNPAMQAVGTLGRSGVDLFFVLSGFLITRILLANRGAPAPFKRFYARRSLRIFPLYFLGLTIYMLVLPWAYHHPPAPLSAQLWGWLYSSDFPETFHSIAHAAPTHYWSLAVEEHFYLAWPALILLAPRRWLGASMFGVIAAAIAIRAYLVGRGIEPYYFTFARMDALAMGGLLALASVGTMALWQKIAWRVGLVVLPVAIVGLYLVFRGEGVPAIQVVKHSVTPLFYLCVLAFLIADPWSAPVRKALQLRPLRWVGTISYGVYVYHPLCLGLVREVVPNFPLAVALGVAVTLGVAAASFYLFERPFLRLKARFDGGRPARGSNASAGALDKAAA